MKVTLKVERDQRLAASLVRSDKEDHSNCHAFKDVSQTSEVLSELDPGV